MKVIDDVVCEELKTHPSHRGKAGLWKRSENTVIGTDKWPEGPRQLCPPHNSPLLLPRLVAFFPKRASCSGFSGQREAALRKKAANKNRGRSRGKLSFNAHLLRARLSLHLSTP